MDSMLHKFGVATDAFDFEYIDYTPFLSLFVLMGLMVPESSLVN